jgi:hypothetical protein
MLASTTPAIVTRHDPESTLSSIGITHIHPTFDAVRHITVRPYSKPDRTCSQCTASTLDKRGLKRRKERHDHFLGVAFFAGAFRPVAFLGAVFFATGSGALVLVTRPDLVFPRTTGGLSSTAGAWDDVRIDRYCDEKGQLTTAGVLRTLLVLALAFVLVAVAFFAAGAFFAAALLVAVFFAAGAFLVAAALVVVAAFFAAGAFFAAAAGLVAVVLGPASLTVPELPVRHRGQLVSIGDVS